MSSTRYSGVALSTLLLVGCGSGIAPLRLAIYYGYPSLVNGSQGDLDRAVTHFSSYDVLVLGDGLEFDSTEGGHAGRAEHEFTVTLLDRLRIASRRTAVFGYVDLGRTQRLSLAGITDRVERWAAMGVDGVFFDEAGYDFGVTRERQNAAVMAAHARGLRVCLNAFRPADVFSDAPTPLNAEGGGNPSGLAAVVSERDAILLESFAVRNGTQEDIEALQARVQTALEGRRRFGTHVFGIATGADGTAETALAQYGWWTASLFGLDAFGWAAPDYGAVRSLLPQVSRPSAEADLERASYLGDPLVHQLPWRRMTTAGAITVDPLRASGTLNPQ